MKKGLFVLFIVLLLAVPAALAKTSAGTLPSSFLWKTDLFFERINLAFTIDTAEKTRLNIQHADERLAEAQAALDVKDSSAANAAIAQREKDLGAALIAFNSTHLADKAAQLQFVTEVQASLDTQTQETLPDADLEKTAKEQTLGLDTALADYDLPDILPLIDEGVPAQDATAVTENTVADTEDTDVGAAVTTDEATDNETTQTTDEADVPVISTQNIFTVNIFGEEISKIHMVVNGIEKNLTLSITDREAIVKEISKRTFLPFDDINKTIVFSGK